MNVITMVTIIIHLCWQQRNTLLMLDEPLRLVRNLNHFINSQLISNSFIQARWDADSRVTIRVTSKPCPKCRTPTERDGNLIILSHEGLSWLIFSFDRWMYAYDLYSSTVRISLVLGVPDGVDKGVHGESLVWLTWCKMHHPPSLILSTPWYLSRNLIGLADQLTISSYLY